MSRAARERLAADELPALSVTQLMVTEAAPDPPPGPERAELAAGGAARVERAVAMMDSALATYIERVANVVEARMRGPRARRGTRWWSDRVKAVSDRGVEDSSLHIGAVEAKEDPGSQGYHVETKALDADYVLPERTVAELGEAIRPVGLRIVADAASSVAVSLGRPNTGLAAFDWRAIETAVDSAVAHMLGAGQRHAADIRREILGADATAETLDAAVDRVIEAVRRGGRWLLLHGRTLATALAGDAALGAARALGVTHVSWVTKHDQAVRASHREVDGHERPLGVPFRVGGFLLRFPGDPQGLPGSWPVIAQCRCSLHFVTPSADRAKAVALAEHGTPAGARRLLDDAALPGGPMVLGAPELRAGMSAPGVPVPVDTVAYRVLDTELGVTPGQRISWPGQLALALAPPAAGVLVLAVALPVGASVGVAGGGVVLRAGTVLVVESVSAGQVVATLLAGA